MEIILINDIQYPNTPYLEQFQLWLKITLENLPENISTNANEIAIKIIDSAESAKLNQTYRKKSGPTNILSFPYDSINDMDNIDEEEIISLGDLAICAELVKAEAAELKIPEINHWTHLTVHGVLHLLGYDHVKEKEAEIMEALEIKILKQLNIENPY